MSRTLFARLAGVCVCVWWGVYSCVGVCVCCEAVCDVAWRGNMWYAQCALHIANTASEPIQTASVLSPCVCASVCCCACAQIEIYINLNGQLSGRVV